MRFYGLSIWLEWELRADLEILIVRRVPTWDIRDKRKLKRVSLSTLSRITYANAFDSDFFLLLRERRSVSLSLMQDAALEVESNILAS